MPRIWFLLILFFLSLTTPGNGVQAEPLKVLFLGDNGHHRPRDLAEVLVPELAKANIELTYTEDVSQLNSERLAEYAGLLLYANIDEIAAEQESALLEYVAQGGGFIPLHCASYCFRNSPAVVDLIGGQFQRHGGQIFSTEIVQPEHPLMQGFGGFESWDETYIHTRHNERNRIVLEVRRQGDQARDREVEPWTWIRTHGSGRVFYTAWGHDARTWKHPGFLNLLERGILWACGQDPGVVADYRDATLFDIPAMTEPRTDVADFKYQDVGPKIPNYLAGESWGTQGEIITQMQMPLSPEESLKHYVTPRDFHLELFAAEPQLQGKPIAMNWDHRGRLWLCETVDYPNELMPPEQGRDRIRICEDTNGDGRADRFTVFAENLSIPTSLEFYRGGVIVQAGVQTIYLRDNDGDDRADQREVLITGWEMGDTHGGVSNFQYGLDNRYWAMQGYNNSRPKFAGGEHPGFRQGPFAFEVRGAADAPQVTDVEFIRSTTNNSWGLGTSEEGYVFASTANRAPSFFVPIANRYYEKVRGWTPSLMADEIAPDHYFHPITDKVRQVDHHGGYTAGAGHALYTARAYPSQWWNRTAFVCGPTGHLIGTFVLDRDGASFRDRNAFNLIASDDEWAAPIQAEVGPDGYVWIIDWYNYIVQHNPTPRGFTTGKGNAYESDLRDKTHGRIYRLVYDGELGQQDAVIPADLSPDDPASLLAGLSHSNRLWRRHAQRLLVERGKDDVVSELVQLCGDSTKDMTGNNPGVIHALWTLHGLGATENPQGPGFQAAAKALSHPAAGVRRNAALVLPPLVEAVSALLSSNVFADADEQVVLAGLLALSDMPESQQAGQGLAELANDSRIMSDPHLRDALICAAARHGLSFLSSCLEGDDLGDEAPLADTLRIVAEHLARSSLNISKLEQLLASLSQAEPSLIQPVVAGLADGRVDESREPLSGKAESLLMALLEGADTEALGPLLRLGKLWGSRGMNEQAARLSQALFEKIEDAELEPASRLQALAELVRFSGEDSQVVTKLLEIVNPQTSPEISRGIIRGLASATAENVGQELLGLWDSITPSLRQDVLSVLISRPETTQELLTAIEDRLLGIQDLSLDQRQTLTAHPSREIRRRARDILQSAGETLDSNRQQVIEQYLIATQKSGDPSAGKALFTKNCAICHKHSGEGNEVGPDLTGMAVHPKEELLVHILDPSRSVEGNFRRYTLLTAGGQILAGMLAAESQSAVELIDAEGKRQTISREDIEQLTSTNKSMMPEGFEQQMDKQQMTDLLEFLTQKGRYVPLPLASVATAISTKGLFSPGDNGPDRMIFEDWSPKEFQGVPFQLVDPLGKTRPNIVLLNGPLGTLPPRMPREISLPCNMRLSKLHLLSGVSGWGHPFNRENTTSMIVRLHYSDGTQEDHELKNGIHFADYISRQDVPESEFAFALRGQQIRYLAVSPQRDLVVQKIDLIKGPDQTAPMVMAITAEQAE